MKLKYLPLEYRNLQIPEYEKKALFFDPKEAAAKIINNYARHVQLPLELLFPKQKTCSCGCGCEVGEDRYLFHSDECQFFAELVRKVFTGNARVIKYLLEQYNGGTLICARCAKENTWRTDESGVIHSSLELDHIIPIFEGGGACWLNNYQVLCHACHLHKNRKDLNKSKQIISWQT